MKFEELDERKKVKLIAEIVSGKIHGPDFEKGLLRYCDKCDAWEHKQSLTMCMLMDAMNSWKTQESHAGDSIRYLMNPKTYEDYKNLVMGNQAKQIIIDELPDGS